MAQEEEVIFRGLPISKGIGIGFPIFLNGMETYLSDTEIPKPEVENEILRYREALDSSRKDLEQLKELSQRDGPPEIVGILGTHLEIMHDPLIISEIEERIRQHQLPTERVFQALMEEYKERFTTLRDSYFEDRVRDIFDVWRRIMGHLSSSPNRLNLAEIPHNSILLAQELVPSETVEATASLISAFVTAGGGLTSHAAIIARAKGIPYVANIDIKKLKKIEFHTLIVDGSQGLIILNPTRHTLKKYQELKHNLTTEQKILKKGAHLHGETIDGYEVRIFANLENPKEIDSVLKNGASGIGLFRSEYLFLSKRQFPSEQEQFEIYKKMVKSLRGGPLVIRVFDVGGDKRVDFLPEDRDAHYFRQIGVEL
ncbi:MAG: phosphoenolpyruvate--protein phosphotransferase, partial [Chlamydiia bacterium]|nr:phosphoenolpyruvate--protein phosphotransferase [Chlamydiia bacterium]